MSIRVKLILTYAILIIVSSMVLFMIGMAIFAGIIRYTTNAIFDDASFDVVIHETIDIVAEIKQVEEYNPEELINPEFHKELNDKLDFFNGGIIVEYQGEYSNQSEIQIYDQEFYELLVPTSHDNVSPHDEEYDQIIKYSNSKEEVSVALLYQNFDYLYGDDLVHYYLLLDISDFEERADRQGFGFLLVVLIILVLITTPLLFIISRNIIMPLKKLEAGVNNIKEGNLDFHLESKKNDEIGRVIQSFEIMRRELKTSIDKQIQYEENRKELISSISHDLKTPMTSIKGYVEGIKDGVANTPEKLEKYLDVIYHKSEDMDQLIDDLFLFSKLDLNKQPFEIKPVNLIEFMREIVQEYKLEWASDNNHIRLYVGKKLDSEIIVEIDLQKMKRVFTNIIQNSIKYMDKDEKEIDIYINDNNQFIQVVISDNGMGIDEEGLMHIFNRFYRVDESRNTKAGGTGLGLAIAKQIVDNHGGMVGASSQIGKGTKIVIELRKTLNS